MKKILVASVLLTLVLGSGAFARSPRWNALGGDHRFIIDDTNYSVYPGSVTMFGNELFVIPEPNFLDNDITGGVLLNKENLTLGFHYNLVSAGASNLREALAGLSDIDKLESADRAFGREDEGTPEWLEAQKSVAIFTQNERLAGFEVRPFPDVIWGMKAGNLGLGVRFALARHSISDAASTFGEAILDQAGTAIGKETSLVEEITTSATALDLSVGASVYETPAGDLDLGLAVGIQSFSGDDPNHGIVIESTGGLDVAFNARLNMDVKEKTLIPLLGLNIGSLPSAEYDEVSAPNVTEISYTNGEVGIGCRKKVKETGLVVVGILGGYGSTKYEPTITIEKEPAEEGGKVVLEKKAILETTDTSLNATVLAGSELPVTDWLIMRGGINVKFSSINDEMVTQAGTESFVAGAESSMEDVVGERKSTAVDYDYNVGLRTIHSGFTIDVILARNIVHRGPYFVTGASGNWGTSVCVTYAF